MGQGRGEYQSEGAHHLWPFLVQLSSASRQGPQTSYCQPLCDSGVPPL